MTAKRFTIKEIDNFSYGIKVTDVILDKDGIELPQSTVCDLLNELHETNEQLRKRVEELECKLQFKKEYEDGEFIELT